MKLLLLCTGLFLLWPARNATAADAHASGPPGQIVIGVGEDASGLERFAARELQGYLRRLFEVQAAVAPTERGGVAPTFLVGTVAGNPNVREILGNSLPRMEEQTILLRKVGAGGASVFVISGGSDRAVLWGVYELVERYGVRYLLHGDVFPERVGSFYLPDLNLTLDPTLAIRCWRLVNGLAMGPESWGLAENEAFIDQLAKMKFNRLQLSFWPWQSYSDYQFHGVSKTTGVSFFGFHVPITPDMVGRALYGDKAEFENPDLAGTKSYADRLQAARRLARGILVRGKRRGMEVGITIQPLEFPKEFLPVLPGARPMHQLGSLTIGPGPGQSIDDPVLADLVATVIQSYVRDYPEADWLHIMMPEHRGWTGEAERAWAVLKRKYRLEPDVTVSALRAQARRRTTYVTGDRADKEVEGDIAALYFFDRVIREKRLLQRPGNRDLRLVYMDVSQELLPYLPKLLPPGGEIVNSVDYTASEVARQTATLRAIPAREVPTSLIYTLADDNVGVLPQMATGSFHVLNQILREDGWRGFYTRYWMIGDLDPAVHYLAKASWDAGITPKSAYRDLIEPVCGAAAVAPFSEALRLIESATTRINKEALSLAFPVPDMMLKHFRDAKWQDPPMPQQLDRDRETYRQALAEVRQARRLSNPPGYVLLDYFIGRLEFAVHYLRAVDLIRQAGEAERAKQPAVVARLLDENLRETKAGLEAFAAVARDNSDRGAIALMNDFAYRSVRDLRQSLGQP